MDISRDDRYLRRRQLHLHRATIFPWDVTSLQGRSRRHVGSALAYAADAATGALPPGQRPCDEDKLAALVEGSATCGDGGKGSDDAARSFLFNAVALEKLERRVGCSGVLRVNRPDEALSDLTGTVRLTAGASERRE